MFFFLKLEENESGISMFWRSISNNSNDSLKISDGQCNSKSSNLISGPWANEIHNENMQKLSSMSEKDILAEQKKLESSLDPKLVSFLKARKSLKNKSEIKNTSKLNDQMQIEENNQPVLNCKMDIDFKTTPISRHDSKEEIDNIMETNVNNTEENIPEPVSEIIKEAGEKGWVHMDTLEAEKVKWMDDLTKSKIDNLNIEEPYNARFDFDGLFSIHLSIVNF